MVQAWRLLREATYEQSGLDTAFFGLTPGMCHLHLVRILLTLVPGLGMGYGGASDATKEVYALRLFLQATPSGMILHQLEVPTLTLGQLFNYRPEWSMAL